MPPHVFATVGPAPSTPRPRPLGPAPRRSSSETCGRILSRVERYRCIARGPIFVLTSGSSMFFFSGGCNRPIGTAMDWLIADQPGTQSGIVFFRFVFVHRDFDGSLACCRTLLIHRAFSESRRPLAQQQQQQKTKRKPQTKQ